MLLTGGYWDRKRVRKYNEAGEVTDQDIPQLLQGRYSHGCSYYKNQEGTIVNIDNLLNKPYSARAERLQWGTVWMESIVKRGKKMS